MFDSRAQLEADKVLNVVVNSFSLLDGRPGSREQTLQFCSFKVSRRSSVSCSSTHMMVWKSSSTRIMSAASLQTSVPVWPIATPMSAAFRATASFTPSPVMATTAPMFWRDCRENHLVAAMLLTVAATVTTQGSTTR